MFITKVVFFGSEGNKTIEIEESTTKNYASMKYSRALDRWFKILTHLEDDNVIRKICRPNMLDKFYLEKQEKIKLQFIKMYIKLCNDINDTNCSLL